MEQWREELYHSSGPWKKHKYIKIENGRYIYPVSRKKNYQGKAHGRIR